MTNISISEIETHLYDKLKKLVSKNTYAGTFPDTIQASWDDMCLIDCSNAIKDFDAYGNGSVLIFLYAFTIIYRGGNPYRILMPGCGA